MRGIKKLKNGKWKARASIVDPRTGKQKEATKTCATRRAAEAALVRLREQLESQSELVSQKRKPRLFEYSTRWLTVRPKVSDNTLEDDSRTVRAWTESWIGEIFIDYLRPADIRRYLKELVDAGYGHHSCQQHLKMFRQITKDAMVEFQLPVWPCERVRNPLPPPEVSDEQPNLLYTTEQAALFLRVAKETEPRWFPVIAFLMFTGMRTCEATALRWEDIDENVIYVRRSNVKKRVAEKTKTGRRLRTPLTQELRDVLAMQREVLRKLGIADCPIVFPNREGDYVCTGFLQKAMNRLHNVLRDKHGLSIRITPHGLRRTANNLLPAEMRKDIIGHMTDRMSHHYSRVSTEDKRAVMGELHGTLHGTPQNTGPGIDSIVSSNPSELH